MQLTDETVQERAILLSIIRDEADRESEESSLAELRELATCAGAEVLDCVLQRRNEIEPATYLGKGKLLEVKELAQNLEANCLIFNVHLTSSQMRNISDLCELQVLDRTMIILDIFAQHARSDEGALQVHIAQLEDRLTRLGKDGRSLSRLGGGIGTRGPGETKLETDRRHIRQQIALYKKRLSELAERRKRMRAQRRRRNFMSCAVCGYTNAGKSSLVNRLCGAELYVCDQLFATLDPNARKMELPGCNVLLVDTVGFIQDLPPQLVNAFHSTLDEVREADLIIQVSDVSDPRVLEQIDNVDASLQTLEASGKARIHILNKIDKANPEKVAKLEAKLKNDGITVISCSVLTGVGIEAVREAIFKIAKETLVPIVLTLPYSKAPILEKVRALISLEEIEYHENGIDVHLRAHPSMLSQLGELFEANTEI